MKKGILGFLALAFSLALVLPAFAEAPAQDATLTAKPPLKTELVHMKYKRAGQMMMVIKTFLSLESTVSWGPDEKVLAIRDYPENIARALAAIQELDIKPADLQFTVQLILGTDTEEKGGETLPSDPIIKELRNLLKYKSYSLLDTSLVRAMDNSDSQVRMGEKAEFELWLKPKVIRDEKSSLIQTEIRLTRITLAGSYQGKTEYITTALIGTTLNIKSGDKTVVGVSKLDGSGKGLILIISGKIVD